MILVSYAINRIAKITHNYCLEFAWTCFVNGDLCQQEYLRPANNVLDLCHLILTTWGHKMKTPYDYAYAVILEINYKSISCLT